MTEKRLSRARSATPATAGGLSGSRSRRAGRTDAPKAAVVAFFGTEDDTPILELLKAVRPTTQEVRTGEYTHVSDVISKCVRRIAIMRRLKMVPPVETIIDGRGITFAIGEALHDFVKDKFIKGHPDKVWARWTCALGCSAHTGTYSSIPTKSCPECGGPINKHNEVSFVDEEYKLKGTPDLLLWMDDYGAFHITEIKSMAAEMWKELVRPVPDHVIQVSFYWRILKSLGMPLINRCSILYVNKEFSFKLPYKEFLIDPTDPSRLQVYLEDLESLKEADAGGALPPRVLCGSEQAPEAKKCAVCATCFGC